MKYDEKSHWALCQAIALSPETRAARDGAALNGTAVSLYGRPFGRPVVAATPPGGPEWVPLAEIPANVPTSCLTRIIYAALQRAPLYDGTDAPLATTEGT